MPDNFASEFTPELSKEYLASLLNPIEQQEEANVGEARREGAAAGLVGLASIGSRIAGAEEAADRAKRSAIAGFNLDVATKKREERLTDEDRAYRDTERQKTESFQESMAKMGYAFEASQNEGALNAAKNALPWGIAEGAVSAGIGGYFGGLGRKA